MNSIEMKTYIGTKIIKAFKSPAREDIYHSKKGDPGYVIEYEDGYKSWSPARVFEKAYRLVDEMNFGLAIEVLKQGKRVARKGWNGVGIFIEMQEPDENSKMTQPYIYIDTTNLQTDNPDAPKCRVPWLASQTDMLADDWVIVV